MRLIRLPVVLAGLSGFSFSTAILPSPPSQHVSPVISPRDNGNIGGLYMCTDIDFTGTCFYLIADIDQCYNMFPDWQVQLSSWGPDKTRNQKDAFFCTLFDQLGCTGKKVELGYPGTGDLSLFQMDNKGKSLSCRYQVPR
ncbi:hypothetical protein BDV96DRAFT_585841 [Lophiotrema nucula]|uniref:Beta/gamma crystallin 'Greek key' domain-containing protein n=1 Tax=Lophiotrema nucula TaxID=690887 RepID=A0A6A5YPI9_9PLEO|nr:hypothetical protein BDV96DRAFT_585841 [Lophiotrema nucula]